MISLSFSSFLAKCILYSLLSNVVPTTAEKILLVGDSYSKLMGQYLELLCTGAEVTNVGIGGTTAAQWQYFTPEFVLPCPESGPWDVVYISVGGNDINKSDCLLSEEDLKILVEKAVENIVKNIAPGAKTYFMTGYAFPTFREGSETCAELGEDLSGENNIINSLSPDLPEGVDFRVFESTYLVGGSPTQWSDSQYFLGDGGHLNSRGYCKFFERPEIFNDVLSCSNNLNTIDCDNTPIIPFGQIGTQLNCADPYIQKCQDSELPFLVNGRKRYCSWVQQKNTALRCAKGKGSAFISQHCPLTCGTCYSQACSDAGKRFYLTNGNLKSCTWVARKDTSNRCFNKEGIRLTCRETCPNIMCDTFQQL